MRSAVRIGPWGGAVLLALLMMSAPAAAAPKPISGELTKPGYTLIALAEDGEAMSVDASAQRFRLVPPAERVSLHLRAADGTYAGPVVVGKEGKRAIVGVEAGAKLGTVKVKAVKGYAKPGEKLAERWLDRERTARATGGVPIGAGAFGHVASASAPGKVPGDTDLDGVPDPLDIDDDGDLVLDTLDSSTAAPPLARVHGAPSGFHITPTLPMLAEFTTSSHIGSSDAEIEQTLPSFGRLGISIVPGDAVELDCGGEPNLAPPPPRLGGLVYCSSGGTGRVFQAGVPFDQGPSFPDCCDADADGFGELLDANPSRPPQGPAGLGINHFARTDQIGTGDVLIQHVATGGDFSQCPPPDGMPSPSCAAFTSTLPFVFATGPALASYSAEVGGPQTVSYPISGPSASPNSGRFTVSDGPDEDADVEATLTFFRPQRRPTPEEPGFGAAGAWMDIGGLAYGVHLADPPGPSQMGGQSCPQTAFSEADDELDPRPPAPSTPGGLIDLAPDRSASTADTLTFTLNITQCLGGTAWSSGEDLGLDFRAVTSDAFADQSGVRFKLP